MEPAKQRMSNSAVKVFKVLDVLTRNFFHGFSPTEISAETGFSMSAINGYINTLVEAGYAERIEETGRIRPSHRFAQKCVQIMNAMNAAQASVESSLNRISRG